MVKVNFIGTNQKGFRTIGTTETPYDIIPGEPVEMREEDAKHFIATEPTLWALAEAPRRESGKSAKE